MLACIEKRLIFILNYQRARMRADCSANYYAFYFHILMSYKGRLIRLGPGIEFHLIKGHLAAMMWRWLFP